MIERDLFVGSTRKSQLRKQNLLMALMFIALIFQSEMYSTLCFSVQGDYKNAIGFFLHTNLIGSWSAGDGWIKQGN